MTCRKPPKLYALSSGEVTFDTVQRDLKKSKIALASDGRPFLPKFSFCYYALHFPIVPCHEGHHKKWGHSKKNFPALRAGICAPTFEMLPTPLIVNGINSLFIIMNDKSSRATVNSRFKTETFLREVRKFPKIPVIEVTTLHHQVSHILLGRVVLVRGVAVYNHQTFAWTICRSVRQSVGACVGLFCALWKTADRIRMPFGIVGHTGPGMRQVVAFGDRSTGRGTFGGEFGTRHYNQ